MKNRAIRLVTLITTLIATTSNIDALPQDRQPFADRAKEKVLCAGESVKTKIAACKKYAERFMPKDKKTRKKIITTAQYAAIALGSTCALWGTWKLIAKMTGTTQGPSAPNKEMPDLFIADSHRPDEIQDPKYGTIIPIPDELKDCHLVHLAANNQYGWTCGTQCVLNAVAMDQLCQENIPITSDNVKQRARQLARDNYQHLITGEAFAEQTEMDAMLRKLGNRGLEKKKTNIAHCSISVKNLNHRKSSDHNGYNDLPYLEHDQPLSHCIALFQSTHQVLLTYDKHNKVFYFQSSLGNKKIRNKVDDSENQKHFAPFLFSDTFRIKSDMLAMTNSIAESFFKAGQNAENFEDTVMSTPISFPEWP